MSKQWFVRMDDFAKNCAQLSAKETYKLIPKNWENTYFHWIDNLRDWCISRQLGGDIASPSGTTATIPNR